jgi:hypothetical protein
MVQQLNIRVEWKMPKLQRGVLANRSIATHSSLAALTRSAHVETTNSLGYSDGSPHTPMGYSSLRGGSASVVATKKRFTILFPPSHHIHQGYVTLMINMSASVAQTIRRVAKHV